MSAPLEFAAIPVDRDEIVQFEKDIVEIPSWTTEEQELARFIHDFMGKNGLDPILQEVELANGGTSYNVISKIEGSGNGPSLTFFGHMDHSPILGSAFPDLDGWKREPFTANIEDGWLYGKGCQDEKGGITAFVLAAVGLVRSGFKPKGDLYFIPVQGHKRVSSGVRKLLETGHRTDYAINTENTGMGLVPYWVGRTEGRVSVRAPELHFHRKDQFPELLRGRRTAMEQLVRIFDALGAEMEEHQPGGWMTFEPTPELPGYPQHRFEEFHFGGLGNLAFNFQVRTVRGQTDETLKRDVERLIAELHAEDPTFQYEVEWPLWESRPPVLTPKESPLVQSIASSHEDVVGQQPDISAKGRSGAAADGSLTAKAGIQTVLYGPGGGETDKEYGLGQWTGKLPKDERILLDDLVNCTSVYFQAAQRLCG
jgi:acetylornithine deacetylase/succinyl-diaminopimelate desuccinylase-like protein